MDTVYEHLTDPELSQDLIVWAEHGHPAFRELCQTLISRASDIEFLNSMGAIYSNELGFLAHPVKRAMVCGTGENVFDPSDMLSDPLLDVAIQIPQDSIAVSGALLRLLLGALLAPRLRLTQLEARRTPAKGVTVWIDELAAFAGPTPGSGAPILDEIVVFGRQKLVRWVYAAQSIQQIERGWGAGTYGKWANSAVLRIFWKVGADPELDNHIRDVAGKTLHEKFDKIPGQGGGWKAFSIVREEVDLLPRERLSKLGESQMIAFVRKDDVGLVKLKLWRPAFFSHRGLRRRVMAAQAKFGGKPDVPANHDYAMAIAATRLRMEEAVSRADVPQASNTDAPPSQGRQGPDQGTPTP